MQRMIVPISECHDVALAGGKAVNLASLMAAGFPVPGGFVLTTHAWRTAHAAGDIPHDLANAILQAYRQLGAPAVAVRSSATAEDLAHASMAGQYETILDVVGEDHLLVAIRKCWHSLDTDRARSYLIQQKVDHAQVAMAVVVQHLVPAEVAGVLFTANPRTGRRDEMMIEASWGLGEAVVSGLVQPDVIRLDHATGDVLESAIHDKHVWIPPGHREQMPVDDDRRRIPCLGIDHLEQLWRLGLRAVRHFNNEQDLEWALHDGKIFLLQSRAVTALDAAAAPAEVLADARRELSGRLQAGHGPWAVHNLAETLPHPTPLTWSILGPFMSGDGGFGRMYAQAGFEPGPRVRTEGFLTLVAGRIYMDLALAPEMFFPGFPFRYDDDLIRRNPAAGQAPPTLPQGSLMSRLSVGFRLAAMQTRLQTLAQDFDQQLTTTIFPQFVHWCTEQKGQALAALDTSAFIELWEQRQRRVMDDFAPQSLLPSLIEAMALNRLRTALAESVWGQDPEQLLNQLAFSPVPDRTVQSNIDLYEVATGLRTAEQWLADHGHRGSVEFDLASPRWREKPQELLAMAERLKGGHSPRTMHEQRLHQAGNLLRELKATLPAGDARELEAHVLLVQRYLRFRENGKHHLMLGYDLLRDCALEAGRRLGIGSDVFLLTRQELFAALRNVYPPRSLLQQRRRRRNAEAAIALPEFIAADALAILGQAKVPVASDAHAAIAISAGIATGPVRIVLSPDSDRDLGRDYVLVCPSTDPSWTPLFVNAAALVLERGGSLSHGAVVAREMGVPAIVLSHATSLLHDGDIVTIDGNDGRLLRTAATCADLPSAPSPVDPDDVRIDPRQVPPPAGRRCRYASRLRTYALAAWGLYFTAVFLLPSSVLYQPSLDLIDVTLWPLVEHLGRPATVAVVAALFAILTMLAQRLLTDHHRLVLAKSRAKELRRQANDVPPESPRHQALLAMAAPVQARLVAASFVPLAVLLGPMVMIFLWMPERVDPASWNPAPGTSCTLIATVDSDWRQPVTLSADPTLRIDGPQTKLVLPIRETLEQLSARWQHPSDLSAYPRELQAAAYANDQRLRASLTAYLQHGVPQQTLLWRITPTASDTAGRFTLVLNTPGQAPLPIAFVLGDSQPPLPRENLNAPGSPLQAVRLQFSPPKHSPVFWAPYSALSWSSKPEQPPWPFGFLLHDLGWLGVYLLAYLPAMILARTVFRVP